MLSKPIPRKPILSSSLNKLSQIKNRKYFKYFCDNQPLTHRLVDPKIIFHVGPLGSKEKRPVSLRSEYYNAELLKKQRKFLKTMDTTHLQYFDLKKLKDLRKLEKRQMDFNPNNSLYRSFLYQAKFCKIQILNLEGIDFQSQDVKCITVLKRFLSTGQRLEYLKLQLPFCQKIIDHLPILYRDLKENIEIHICFQRATQTYSIKGKSSRNNTLRIDFVPLIEPFLDLRLLIGEALSLQRLELQIEPHTHCHKILTIYGSNLRSF